MKQDYAPVMTVETITPADAHRYLATMGRNRKMRPRHLETLTQAIVSGHWYCNGETIKFDTTGALIDGQHRLLAVVKANVAIQSYVVRHLEAPAQETVDIGLKRSPGDILGLEGYANATNLCAAARWIWRYETQQMIGYAYSPRIETLKDVVATHPELKNSLSYGTLIAGYITRSLGSALHCLLAEQDGGLAEQLVVAIREGEGLTRSNPFYLLRQRLIANSQAKAKLPDAEVAALTVKAFNASRQGQTLRFLRWRTSGDTPEPFPTIV